MKVGIIGAGTMGSGIAQAFAQVDGYEVCFMRYQRGVRCKRKTENCKEL